MASTQCPVIALFQQKDASWLIGIGRAQEPRCPAGGRRAEVIEDLNPERCLWRHLNGFEREPVTSGCCDN
jgi:hypothetical protein